MELRNVLVGDVWLCGGQSNMGLPLQFARNGAEDVKTANYPEIRFFSVEGHPVYRHSDVIAGSWKAVSPETAGRLSAVGYYFARKLQHEIHVPIGLVVDALGGQPPFGPASHLSASPAGRLHPPVGGSWSASRGRR